ncbi:ATP-binding protein [Sphingomonas aracearum]|uniref:histidine kinase n=1 Tax=Sphingomonas aracearum TaxID=2283317 RepID=A0A369W283_9SPHN|nr:ATP-binding protein [Sphingomonas aracearum]RDE06171.1 HAMP domain-containing protein [Sphingomonas aracearum]
MNASLSPTVEPLAVDRRSSGLVSFVEFIVLAVAVGIALTTYFVITGENSPQRLLTPPLVALLLVANLVPGVALLVLIGRRIALGRARRTPGGGNGRLHVRLVATFSVLSSVPMLLVTIFASLLFQYGVEFWFSDRARGMLENASVLAQENYRAELKRVNNQTATMTQDLRFYLQTWAIDSNRFSEGFALQVYQRELSEALIVESRPGQPLRALALVNPYERPLEKVITPAMIQTLEAGKATVVVRSPDRIGVVTPLDRAQGTYLYAARVFDPGFSSQLRRGEAILADYRALLARSRSLQLRFNAALLIVSLLIVGLAVFVALAIADRLVRPISELVEASGRIAEGDLTARVVTPRTDDEIGVLGHAFNEMTGRLERQTSALVSANRELDSRRQLIEAVMSGVSAGVLSLDRAGTIRTINRSAATLLGRRDDDPVGKPLAEISPELSGLIAGDERDAIVEAQVGDTSRTLAVKIARAAEGPILTFDDITEQLLDQRRAAWSDVARRIAHEIKNPLTPIQLAAERLQRRYARQLPEDDGTFTRLTETIIRQVGDLRRMVDEFSSFARMPKPVFRAESLVDIASQSMFLHEVAHPAVKFVLDHEEPGPELVCDRRQIGQALTNIVKNAVEAIEARREMGGEVRMAVSQSGAFVTVEVADNGTGLPAARERLVEPYVTTRARGTGLGLAIVKKIIEEHFGIMSFSDREGGGTVVCLRFNTTMLAALDDGDPATSSLSRI